MNFLVESGLNSTFNGLNKVIFEYLNFRPFLEELLNRTSPIHKNMEDYCREAGVQDLSTRSFYINTGKGLYWYIGDNINSRSNLRYLFKLHNLGVKQNSNNFGYYRGMNMCYIDY